VLVAVAAGTEPLEAAATADILDRAGARVTVATASEGLVVEASHEVRFAVDGRVADLEAKEFDLIVLPVRRCHDRGPVPCRVREHDRLTSIAPSP
jgi:putative intracellular protease/amidase